MKCKDCKFFKRGKWHKQFGGGPQYSGRCKVLLKVLKISNASMVYVDELTVQDSFGCSVGKKND